MDPLEYRPMYPNGYGDDAGAPEPAPGGAPPPFVSSNPLPTSTDTVAPGMPLPAPAPAASSAGAAKRNAGLAIVLVGTGAGAGALLGGAWGAGSGLFFAGAANNAFRARQLFASDFADDRAEAVKRTVMSVVGLGLAGYLGYRAHQAKEDDD